jgi:tetratricopeptide (TPR) repeat protein
VERGNHEAAKPQLLLAIEVCKTDTDQLQDLLADSLFALSELGIHVNMPANEILTYTKQCLRHRAQLDDGTWPTQDALAVAHSQIGQAYLLCGDYDQAIQHCQASKAIDFASNPDFIKGLVYPQYAIMHEAYVRSAMGEHDKAVELLREILEFRKLRFGAQEKGSYK